MGILDSDFSSIGYETLSWFFPAYILDRMFRELNIRTTENKSIDLVPPNCSR